MSLRRPLVAALTRLANVQAGDIVVRLPDKHALTKMEKSSHHHDMHAGRSDVWRWVATGWVRHSYVFGHPR